MIISRVSRRRVEGHSNSSVTSTSQAFVSANKENRPVSLYTLTYWHNSGQWLEETNGAQILYSHGGSQWLPVRVFRTTPLSPLRPLSSARMERLVSARLVRIDGPRELRWFCWATVLSDSLRCTVELTQVHHQ